MKKRRWEIILLTLILAAVTVLLPVAAMAAEAELPAGVLQDEESRGLRGVGNEFTTESGFNCNVNENDGTVTITGYVDEKYTAGEDLEIPEVVYQGNLQYEVTQIGKYAFQNKNFLNGKITLPKTLIYIETNAFFNCSGLIGDLIIPDSVVSIGEGAFYDCTGFTGKLKLGSGLEEIGAGAFHRCCFTGNLQIPSSVNYIGNAAFFQCSGFTGGLSLTGNNMIIGGNDYVQDADCLDRSVFYQCNGLSGTLTIGEGVTELYERAFYDLPNITRVVNNSDFVINLSMLDKNAMVIDNNDSPWTNKATGERITSIGKGIAVRDDYDGTEDGEESQEDEYTKQENTYVAGQKIQDFGQTYFKDFSGLITKYRTNPKKVATVSKKGVLKAKKPGQVTIEALAGKGKAAFPVAYCTITILEKPKLKFPKLSLTSLGTKMDGYQYFLTPSTRTTRADFWESSRPAVAQVDPVTGEITVMGPGTTRITAYFGMPGVKGTLKVKAKLKVKK